MTTLRHLPNTPDLHRINFCVAFEEPNVLDEKPSALVAHENPDLRRLLRSVLTEHLGMADVFEADCLDVAIEQLAADHRITLLIISLDLQGVDPSVTVRLLREHFPGVRVVVTSSCRDGLAALRSLAAEAYGHIDIGTNADGLAETLDLIRRDRHVVPSRLMGFRCEHD